MKSLRHQFVIEIRAKGPSKTSVQGWKKYRSYKLLDDAVKALQKFQAWKWHEFRLIERNDNDKN